MAQTLLAAFLGWLFGTLVCDDDTPPSEEPQDAPGGPVDWRGLEDTLDYREASGRWRGGARWR